MNPSQEYDYESETLPAPIFDPFPEPQTIPKGWDLSGLRFGSPSTLQPTDWNGEPSAYAQDPL